MKKITKIGNSYVITFPNSAFVQHADETAFQKAAALFEIYSSEPSFL